MVCARRDAEKTLKFQWLYTLRDAAARNHCACASGLRRVTPSSRSVIAARHRLVNTIVVVGVQDAEPLEGCLNDDILMIRDQWPFHGDLDLLAPSSKLPPIDLATAGKAPVDAVMAVQIGRRLRLAASC